MFLSGWLTVTVICWSLGSKITMVGSDESVEDPRMLSFTLAVNVIVLSTSSITSLSTLEQFSKK